jgi:hypothetical protein
MRPRSDPIGLPHPGRERFVELGGVRDPELTDEEALGVRRHPQEPLVAHLSLQIEEPIEGGLAWLCAGKAPVGPPAPRVSHPGSILPLPSQRSFPCIPNCSERSPPPDMRSCSLRVEPEGSQEAASMTIRRGSLAPGGAWAPCSSGQAHAWPVTSGPRWSWLTSSPDRPPDRRDARGRRVRPRRSPHAYTSHAAATTCSISDNSAGLARRGCSGVTSGAAPSLGDTSPRLYRPVRPSICSRRMSA